MPAPSPATVRQCFVGIGANLGDRWATMDTALLVLAKTPGITALERSVVFETLPVGITDQPLFLNLVVGLETTLFPEELMSVLLALELSAGRDRAKEQRWGPRTLDLDLLLFENEARPGPDLILPHPRLWDRSFVLVPLAELLHHSLRFHRPIWQDLHNRLDHTSVSRIGLQLWAPSPS